MALKTEIGSRVKPAGGLELKSWIFMRVSGVLLVALALGHMWIMHVVHGVDQIDYDFVVRRLAGPFLTLPPESASNSER